jgi:tripartite-type tricarboxylate transporter receptor subunit TctC
VFPPGGSVDQVSRIIAPVLSLQLGQSVIVENKGGASGVIGTSAVLSAPADGYTFAVVFDTHGVNQSLMPNMPYDSKRDLVPLILVGTSAMVLTSNVGNEYKTFADVVAAAKARKNVSFGTIGNGSLGHLAMALLGKNANLEFNHIPYKGGGPLMTDAVAGHVPLAMGTVFLSKPHIDNKRIRPLAVTSLKRVPEFPEVPTIAEAGFPAFDAYPWFGILAPAGTPREIVQMLSLEVAAAVQSAEIGDKLRGMNFEPTVATPESFTDIMRSDLVRWGRVVREAKVKAAPE